MSSLGWIITWMRCRHQGEAGLGGGRPAVPHPLFRSILRSSAPRFQPPDPTFPCSHPARVASVTFGHYNNHLPLAHLFAAPLRPCHLLHSSHTGLLTHVKHAPASGPLHLPCLVHPSVQIITQFKLYLLRSWLSVTLSARPHSALPKTPFYFIFLHGTRPYLTCFYFVNCWSSSTRTEAPRGWDFCLFFSWQLCLWP